MQAGAFFRWSAVDEESNTVAGEHAVEPAGEHAGEHAEGTGGGGPVAAPPTQ